MQGTVAVTDEGWYSFLQGRPNLTEVNFWRPSAYRAFRAPEFSPFMFKLRSPHNAVCGFAYFARYSRLPVWLAWEVFEQGNGVESLAEMEARLARIRKRFGHKKTKWAGYIGCTLLVQPTFFPREAWVRQPEDWSPRTQADSKYDLAVGEGRRVWEECLAVARELGAQDPTPLGAESPARYGEPVLVRPRLGQGSFRIAVTDAYGRACAATGEHSLPVLDAAHIVPFQKGGSHEVRNGLLLRADLHRLFDKGYFTVTPDLRMKVSSRLKEEFHNGATYYPLDDGFIRLPQDLTAQPNPDFLAWHNQEVFAV